MTGAGAVLDGLAGALTLYSSSVNGVAGLGLAALLAPPGNRWACGSRYCLGFSAEEIQGLKVAVIASDSLPFRRLDLAVNVYGIKAL